MVSDVHGTASGAPDKYGDLRKKSPPKADEKADGALGKNCQFLVFHPEARYQLGDLLVDFLGKPWFEMSRNDGLEFSDVGLDFGSLGSPKSKKPDADLCWRVETVTLEI